MTLVVTIKKSGVMIRSGCHGFKPQLYPNVTELQINEGDTLKITCMSKGYINFHFPTSNARGRTTSQPDIIPEGRSTNKTFIRSSTVFGDTGWYCCADESKRITNMTFKNHNEQGVTWIKPNIKVNGLKDMTVGSKLSLKCTVKVRREALYNIFWKIPNNMTSRIIFNNVQEVAEKYYTYDLITSELIVDNVTFGDKGYYECQVKSSFNKTKSTHTYICIYDSNKPYIHLTSNNKNVYGNYGDSVTFVAYATACPTPNFKWVDNHGFRIHSDPSLGYSILTKYNESTLSMSLRIDNIKPFNRGFYTLSAGNIAGKKELTFHLKFLDKPRVWLNTSYPKGYYSFNESVTFACHVESKSKFNISWTYKRHLKFKFQYIDETNKILRLHGMNTNETSNNAESESIVMISPLGRSTIKCTACNKDGCVNKEHDIYVTDGVPNKAFGVIEPKTKFYESQNISLVCAAVIHIFSEVLWYDNKNEKIVDSERIHVTFKETNYTERAILSITNVSRSDERDYYCVTKNLYGKIREKYSLKINIPAYFVHVNMNDFAIIRFAKDPENPVYLLCYIGGTPTPNITWFKDGTPLESSKQFSLEDRNQKLVIRYLLERDSGNQELYIWIAMIVWFITILISLLMYFYLKTQHAKFKEKKLLEAGSTNFKEGAVDLINPDLTVDEQAELLPYDIRWEFPIEKLRLGKKL
ncbi:vascular endothelial growth factor receptor 2-like [Copidosoma floridanum]|uniref:vascular endothelial growth factor receptor 2-like n=1 Tax=Copidosoma floridanum TaxID=29053 RepID=UPI000C6F7AAA|nr:vascular endothelial growth factor receptor 2-like [Copidosoma floridanum]